MRAVISGSSGFIGRALQRALEDDGVVVHPVVRHEPGAGEIGINAKARSLDTSALPGGDLRDVDVVFNLAGEPLTPRRWGPAKIERIRASRILTTDLLARAIGALEKDEPPALVSMSAVGYYGSRGDEFLTEDSAAGTGFLAETCRSWEAATAPARDAGARVVRCRTGIVFGHGGGALARQAPLFRFGLGGKLGSGQQWTSWVALADAVAALRFCANDPTLSGAVNLCAPTAVRNAELTATLARLVHRPALLPVPAPVLRLALGKRVAGEVLLASQRCVPERLLSAGYQFLEPALEDCLAEALSFRRRS